MFVTYLFHNKLGDFFFGADQKLLGQGEVGESCQPLVDGCCHPPGSCSVRLWVPPGIEMTFRWGFLDHQKPWKNRKKSMGNPRRRKGGEILVLFGENTPWENHTNRWSFSGPGSRLEMVTGLWVVALIIASWNLRLKAWVPDPDLLWRSWVSPSIGDSPKKVFGILGWCCTESLGAWHCP